MYVPTLVSASDHRNESLAIIGEMINDRSGLWQITEVRTDMLRRHLDVFSNRSKSAVEEMIAIAERGDRLWPTKAEYYSALSEIKSAPLRVNQKKVDAVISDMIKGSRMDNVSDRAWVRQAIEILRKISSDV